jgi:hypothetical protein
LNKKRSLQEITQSLGTFNNTNERFADEIISKYEKAGLTTSAKLAKIAKHGFKFFEKSDLIKFVSSATDKLNKNLEKNYVITKLDISENDKKWYYDNMYRQSSYQPMPEFQIKVLKKPCGGIEPPNHSGRGGIVNHSS